MLIFEEEGIKKSFKIIINTKGIIIKTKGLLSSSYNEVYSKLFHEVNSITLNNKILQTEFVIDNITLYFNDNDEANIVSKLIALGKSNTEILIRYIGVDTQHVDICDIELDDLDDDVSTNRFNRTYLQEVASPAGVSNVGMSPESTLDHIISMRLKAMGTEQNQQTSSLQHSAVQAPPQMQVGTVPPSIGSSCFSFYAHIEGKQQGPYDEKQFGNLVQYGLVDANTPVWKEGMTQWQNANTVPEMMKFFQPVNNMDTPPPPPQAK